MSYNDTTISRMAEHIDANMGSMLIGIIISAVLLGVSLVQTFYYYMSYPKDPWYLKGLVAITALFDTIHLAMITHTIYHYLITNYNNPTAMENLVWSVLMEALFTGVTGALVQCFYLTRVWMLSNKNIFITGFILAIVVANAVMGTVWVVESMQLETFDQLLAISPITISINALSTSADVLIAVTLCFLLHRIRTGFKKSDSMINRLMLFVVNTGVLTSMCAIGSLIALVTSPRTLIYATFYFCIGRLYTNSFLATLNGRKVITGQMEDVSNMLMSTPPTLLDSRNTGGLQKGSQPTISIRIDTSQQHHGTFDSTNFRTRSRLGEGLDTKNSFNVDEDLELAENPVHNKSRQPLEKFDRYDV